MGQYQIATFNILCSWFDHFRSDAIREGRLHPDDQNWSSVLIKNVLLIEIIYFGYVDVSIKNIIFQHIFPS